MRAVLSFQNDMHARKIQERCSWLCDTDRVGKRAEGRSRIEAQIIALGRRQLVTEGAAGLSLRAIARDLGMVSSAVYRYVASRDELITLLLVDAYSELADTVDGARAAATGWDAQISAIAHAARSWAVDHPASWALLYGSPVPGYHAPAERTVGPGTRVVGALFGAVSDGLSSGAVRTADLRVPRKLSADFDRLRDEFGFAGRDAVVARCMALWAGLVGAISLEVFGQYGADTLTDPADVFDVQVRLWVNMLSTT